MHRSFARIALAALVVLGASSAFAAADPSLHDVYAAANSGHLEQAQTMMQQVLRDHPGSAKAHYVAAEIYAREGRATQARSELGTAQSIDPRLSFVSPASVNALRTELAQGTAGRPLVRTPGSGFPIGWIVVLGGALLLIWLMFRRRAMQAPVVVQSPGGMGAGPYATPYGPYGAAPMGGGGLGSSLASGLAMGAGVVAGEELIRHFTGGEHQSGIGAPGFEESGAPPVNGDMGGSDFGVSDPGSWDDSGGGFGGGGDDWS